MKIAVATAHDAGYKELADVTLPTVSAYCTTNGYELWYDDDIGPTEKDACKARIFRELYRSGQYGADDLFMWIDTDALIMNPSMRIEKFWEMNAWDDVHFIWGYDFNGPNSGVWIARFSAEAEHYVRVYDATARGMGWGDQEAMMQKMLVPPFDRWVFCLPGKALNCYDYALYNMGDAPHRNSVNNYEPGDWILHLCGIEPRKRLELAKHYAAQGT